MAYLERLTSKFMMSPAGKQTITIDILPNISRGKGSQTMKFGQLIAYNMKNIFLEKTYSKCGGETIPSPLSKSKLNISLNRLKFLLYAK